MGQGASRTEVEPQQSSERQDAPSRPSSAFFGQRQTHDTPSRTRRYSGLVNTLLQRSSSETSVTSSNPSPPTSVRRRTMFRRATSSLNNVTSMLNPSNHNLINQPTPMTTPLQETNIERTIAPNSGDAVPIPPQLRLPEHIGHDLGLLHPLSPQTSTPVNPPRPTPNRPQSFADRISSLTPSRDFRNFTGSWRRRRSPAPTPELDSSAALSRLLSVAAAATAATLMGGNVDHAIRDLRAASGEVEGEDGTFSSFLQTLRSGRLTGLTQGNRNGTNGMNTFRMFRFGSAPGTSASSQSASDQSAQQDTQGQPAEQRMIPVLIVGIRAFNGDAEVTQEPGESVPSFFDALSGLPTNMDVDSTGSTQGGPSGRRRRVSMAGSTVSPLRRDEFRRLRPTLDARPRSFAAISELPERSIGTQTDNTPVNIPSLQAIPALPAVSNNSLLAGQSRRRDFDTALDSTAADEASSPPPRPARRRRLSDSDTPRYGAGSPRRNGVLVEPHDAPPAEGQHRSWIIYILGGSYPADHPILTTPSLFTDSPTYEDMIRLSALLGPAKPPVANAEDVAAAPGVLKIKIINGVVHATGDGDDMFVVVNGERCLVCLCDYEDDEEVRQLVKCSHFFHRECIDQVCASIPSMKICNADMLAVVDYWKELLSFVPHTGSGREREDEPTKSRSRTCDRT